ncbi:MAG: choice-of-anchor B family protein [Bacteroidetes bacterium]|nr:choice-of-anchor B family protein [Bacteroidota bacterium]
MRLRYMNSKKVSRKKSLLILLYTLGLLGLGARPSWGFQDEKGASEAVQVASKFDNSNSTPCQDGFAGDFPCQNVNLVSYMQLSEIGALNGIRLNDMWGWQDPDTRRKYALVGREDGVAFVDLTIAAAPVYVGQLFRTQNTPPTVWRDIKVDGFYAFVVADGTGSSPRHGMQVFDLRRLRTFAGSPITFTPDALYTQFSMAHNIAINEESHRAFIVGARGEGEACGGGLHIVDISQPLSPTFLGCFADPSTGRSRPGYSHDTQCVVYSGPDPTATGREICVSSNVTAISIVDITNPSTPINLSTGKYPNSGYIHQGWFTEDQRYFIQDDELDESAFGRKTRTMIWDLSVLREPELLTIFESDVPSIDHNLYVRDGFAFQANYTSGLRILDLRTPQNPETVGWFDTTPSNNLVSMNGAWTAYPYLDEEYVVVTSRQEGLFVVQSSEIVGTRFASTQFIENEGRISLQWTMSNEHNVVRFDIEKRLTDGSYEVVSTLNGNGGIGLDRAYQSTFSLDEGVYQVRVTARSADGGVVSSPDQVVVVMSGAYLLDKPYPNPVSGVARATLAVKDSQEVQIDLYDTQGRRVQRVFQDEISQGTQVSFSIDVSSLPGGVYFVRVVGERFTTSSEVVVVR